MKTILRLIKLALFAAGSMLLTSCGGGGGGDASNTNNGQTVVNTAVGVQLTQPSTMQSQSTTDAIRLWPVGATLSPDTDPVGPPSVFVTFDSNPTNLLLAQFYDGSGPGEDLGASVEQLTVGGRAAYMYRPEQSLSADTVIIIPVSGGFVHVLDRGARYDSSGTLSEILNSISILK